MKALEKSWTLEEIELLRKLAAKNLSSSEILRFFPGRTRNAILGKIFRIGVRLDNRTPSFWRTGDNLNKLEKLANSPLGYSTEEVAEEFGITMRMVREGLTIMRGQGIRIRRPAPVRKDRPATAKARGAFLPAEAGRQPTPDLTHAVSILGLHATSCRWPVADHGAAMLYCGRASLRERPYCREHCRVAYVR